MNKKVLKIEIEDVNKIQSEHVILQTYRDTIAYLFDMNRNNPSFLDSPIFLEYQKKCQESTFAFEDAKTEVFNKYFPQSGIENPINWSLDYSTGELTINY